MSKALGIYIAVAATIAALGGVAVVLSTVQAIRVANATPVAP